MAFSLIILWSIMMNVFKGVTKLLSSIGFLFTNKYHMRCHRAGESFPGGFVFGMHQTSKLTKQPGCVYEIEAERKYDFDHRPDLSTIGEFTTPEEVIGWLTLYCKRLRK